MLDYPKTELVNCIMCDIHPTSLMRGVSVKALQTLLSRMGVEYEENLPREAYLLAWYDQLCQNRSWILYLLSSEHLNLLCEIWDSDAVEMDEYRWSLIEYLRVFGFVTFHRGNSYLGQKNEILIVESMKQSFYFLLKSRDSKKQLKEFERWENIFFGLTYYYGIIPLENLYDIFCELLGQKADYESFYLFIKCRADVWGLGSFLKDRKNKEYFMNQNVEEAEYLLLYLEEHKDLDYKRISYDNLSYIKYGFGIDNRWPGLSELGNLLVNEMDLSYYRSTVMVHAIMLAIQNGKNYEHIKAQLDLIPFEEDQRQKAEEYVHMMYEGIPVFEYKGYSHKEFIQISREKEWKRRRNRFTMISGGKK